MNARAQAAWYLRLKFEATHRAVYGQRPFDPDDLISIDSKLAELLPLQMELAQPTYDSNAAGKIFIVKTPPGMKSPNLFDAVLIAYQPKMSVLALWQRLGE